MAASHEQTPIVDSGAATFDSASADSSDAAASKVSAWTDAPIVARLREDCGFDPRKLSDPQKEELFGSRFVADQLMCLGSGFDQSCVYDPCFETDERTCKSDCLKDCSACDDACVSSCFACKANCGDDDCRNACAPTCAHCKQTCLTQQDDCHSGKCGRAYADCRKKLDADWKTQKCAAVCTQYTPCKNACYDKIASGIDPRPCDDKCKAQLKTSCDLNLCPGRYSMGIDMK